MVASTRDRATPCLATSEPTTCSRDRERHGRTSRMNGTGGKLEEVATIMAKEVSNTVRRRRVNGTPGASATQRHLHAWRDSSLAGTTSSHLIQRLHICLKWWEMPQNCVTRRERERVHEEESGARRFSRRAQFGGLSQDTGKSTGADSFVRATLIFCNWIPGVATKRHKTTWKGEGIGNGR